MAEAIVNGARNAVHTLYGVLVPNEANHQHARRADSDDNGSQNGGYGMNPPPDFVFDSRDKLIEALKTWAAAEGYAVVIGRSRTNRLWIRCDRGGAYHDKHAEDPSQRKRKRKVSRLTGCEFSVKASKRKDGIWRSRTEHGEHNHEPSEDLREHPSLRRMSDEQLEIVYAMTEGGSTPAEIMAALTKRWPEIKVIRRDIYNARKNYKSTKHDDAPQEASTQPVASDRGPESTDDSRWAWAENDGLTAKRRRTDRTTRDLEQEREATATATASQLPALNDRSAGQISEASATVQPARSHMPPWPRMSGSSSDPPNLSSQTLHFQPQTIASPRIVPGSQQPRGPGQNASHTVNSQSPGFNTGRSKPPSFPQHILTTDTPNPGVPEVPLSSLDVEPRPVRSQGIESQIHPDLRGMSNSTTLNRIPSNRTERQPAAPSQANIQQQPPAYRPGTGTRTPSNSSVALVSSRPATASMQTTQVESSGGGGQVTGMAPTQAKQQLSGAWMMQRLQRVEDELREQKSELREQKSMLSEILSVVKNLKN